MAPIDPDEVLDRLGFDPRAPVPEGASSDAPVQNRTPDRAIGHWHDLGAFEDDDPEPAIPEGLIDLAAILLRRPAWMDDALCQEYADTVTWFPERGESTEPAKAVCARCLCQQECSEFAQAENIRHGIWAGQSARARQSRKAA